MYSRKSVGPRMKPWGIQALAGYSSADVQTRTTQSLLLLRKDKIKPNIWPEIWESESSKMNLILNWIWILISTWI